MNYSPGSFPALPPEASRWNLWRREQWCFMQQKAAQQLATLPKAADDQATLPYQSPAAQSTHREVGQPAPSSHGGTAQIVAQPAANHSALPPAAGATHMSPEAFGDCARSERPVPPSAPPPDEMRTNTPLRKKPRSPKKHRAEPPASASPAADAGTSPPTPEAGRQPASRDDESLMRRQDLLTMLAWSKSKLSYVLNKKGTRYDPTFPQPLHLAGSRTPYWRRAEVAAWIDAQAKKRDA